MRTNLAGRVYGKLTVTEASRIEGPLTFWLCKCECGKEIEVRSYNLVSGNTTSCGCIRSATKTKHGHSRSKTREKVSPEYAAYVLAKQRCTNPKNEKYKSYGGRGIQFEFKTFEEFLEHIGPRPSSKHSLDRIKVNENYAIGNFYAGTGKHYLQPYEAGLRSFLKTIRQVVSPALNSTDQARKVLNREKLS